MGKGKTPVHFSSAPVVLMESFTYGKCLNLPVLFLCLCDGITSTLQYCAGLWYPEIHTLGDIMKSNSFYFLLKKKIICTGEKKYYAVQW